jgi:formate dehydrogenase subunit delta
MHADTLVKMANQIGDFFEAMPDRDEAIEGIALHIKRFWEPRMRHEFLAYIDAHDADASKGSPELHAIVLEAVRLHRAELA